MENHKSTISMAIFNSYVSLPEGIPYMSIWVCLKMVSTPNPNGFADHYPVFEWLFHWEYT